MVDEGFRNVGEKYVDAKIREQEKRKFQTDGDSDYDDGPDNANYSGPDNDDVRM